MNNKLEIQELQELPEFEWPDLSQYKIIKVPCAWTKSHPRKIRQWRKVFVPKTELDINLPRPILIYDNDTTVWSNFSITCTKMNRTMKYVQDYVLYELKTLGSFDTDSLTIKGRIEAKQLKKIIARYVKRFIKCKICESTKTALIKENDEIFLDCKRCFKKNNI